jgi:formate dehydrogenase iron-sulfur subunit
MAEITGKMMLIDTSVCMGCRSCQVACKQWHHLPGEPVENLQFGHYENPKDLSGTTFTRMLFNEVAEHGAMEDMEWLFFKDQCRHCVNPPCHGNCPVPGAIVMVEPSGAVVFTDACDPGICKNLNCISRCRYGIPRFDAQANKARKCDFCFDRFDHADLDPEEQIPICAKTCPPGAITFDDAGNILDLADTRLAELEAQYPKANIYPDSVNKTRVLWLLMYSRGKYRARAEKW